MSNYSASAVLGASPPSDLKSTRRRLQVIVNPTARHARGSGLETALRVLRDGGAEVELLETRQRGDAEDFARAAVEADAGPSAIIAAGGDGTINEVINGMAGGALPLGILPLGTANVLAAEIGLSGNIQEASGVILAGRTRPVHLGTCNGRLFAMMTGAGFDARVVASVDPAIKRRLGKTAYVLESLAELMRYRPTVYRVSIDGAPPISAGSVIVANGHFYAGRFIVAPDARLDVAEFEVCLFRGTSRLDALRYTTAMTLGLLGRLSDVTVLSARSLSIEGPQAEPVQADGDIIAALPVTLSVAPHRLSILAP